VVVYATALKSLLAGVDAALLAERGPVDPEVAGALAAGVRTALGATIGVAVTGVAGPDRQHGVAVGTVFGALAGPGGVQTREWHFDGMRGEVRAAAVQACLTLIGTEFERVR
jgi:nicotinamide-nucleotide amidase